MVRILHIASGDLWAGAEVQLFHLVCQLNKMENINIQVVLLNHGRLEERLIASNVQTIVLDESKLNPIKILFNLLKIIKQMLPNIVHTHRFKENILGSLAAVFFLSVKCVRTVHGAPEYSLAYWEFHKRLFHYMDYIVGKLLQARIVAVSSQLNQILSKKYGSLKVSTITNGIEVKTETNHTTVLQDSLLRKDSFKVALVGRLSPVKRPEIFIKIALLAKKSLLLDMSFYIFGDGPLREELELEIKSNDIGNCVYMMDFKENMLEYLKNMDALVIVSDHEGLPMVMLEALSVGVPVVAHSVGGIPDVLNQGPSGLLIESQNPDDYLEALIKLKNNNTNREIIIDNGRSLISGKYSINRCAYEYYELYKEIVINERQ